jgi:hypothetical protein
MKMTPYPSLVLSYTKRINRLTTISQLAHARAKGETVAECPLVASHRFGIDNRKMLIGGRRADEPTRRVHSGKFHRSA